jgi:hypothetical protein
MSKQIKISGDTTELRKSILELSKMVSKDLAKSKIELFTPDTKKFLRGEALSTMESIKKQIDSIKDSTKRHQQALAEVVRGSKEELKIKEKIVKASQHIAKLEQARGKTSNVADQMSSPGFMKQFGKFSGLSTILKGVKGLGGGAGMGMGMLGGALGLGGAALAGYGISRVMASRQTYGEGIDTRLKLRGRGVSDLSPTDTQGMLGAGLNSLSLRQARMRDMDVFGRQGASQSAVIGRASFERNYGLEEGTMSGIGAGLRSSLGGNGANQTVMKLQASLMASGITDAIGPYLETAAAMLTDLNEKGFTMDDSVLSLFNSMSKTGMGEGRINQLMSGADQGIRGSTGESNAFFQSVFNKAGIGGGTIGGAQAAMRMGGLYGVDLDKYKGMGGVDRKMFQQLGIGGGDHMQNVASATLGSLDQLFGSDKDIAKQQGSGNKRTRDSGNLKRLSRLRYVMQAFQLKDEGQASEVEGMLKQASTASPKERQKIMDKIKSMKEKTPELENLEGINKSNDGIYDILKNQEKTNEDKIGEALSGAFNATNELLASIDGAILSIAKFMTGYQTPAERQQEIQDDIAKQEKMAKGRSTGFLKMNGMGGLPSKEDLSMGLDFNEGMALTKEIQNRAAGEKDKGFFTKNRSYERELGSGKLDPYIKGLQGLERRAGRGDAEAKKQLELLSRQNSFLETIARNSKEKGTLKPGSASTTGN